MKTLFKTYHNGHQSITRRNKFQEKTGLKWEYYSTGDGIRFTPIVTKYTPIDSDKADRLLPYLEAKTVKNTRKLGFRGFVDLAEETGMTLTDVLVAAKTLVKQNQAVCGVNRMGGFSSIRAKFVWEK